jgi:hypothetical protein
MNNKVQKIIKYFISFDIILMVLVLIHNLLTYTLRFMGGGHGDISEFFLILSAWFFFPFYLYFPIIEFIIGMLLLIILLDQEKIFFKLKEEYLFYIPLILFIIYAIYYIINIEQEYIINIIFTCISISIWIKILFYADIGENKIYLKLYSIISFLHYIVIYLYWFSFKY